MGTASGTTVALFGATGLVGRECMRLLLADPGFARVIAIGRRPLPPALLPADAGTRLEQRVADFEDLGASAGSLAVDRVLCALGTTMKQAGSKEAFRRVDHDFPLEIARLALERAVPHFLLVSAIGADADSRVFYNAVKGELEDAVRALPFRSTTIVRPSLLLGEREDRRAGEMLAGVIGRLVPGRWRPVRAADVARVLVDAARENRPGGRIIESGEIRALARAPKR